MFRKSDQLTDGEEEKKPCPQCGVEIPEFDLTCSECKSSLPYCVVTVSAFVLRCSSGVVNIDHLGGGATGTHRAKGKPKIGHYSFSRSLRVHEELYISDPNEDHHRLLHVLIVHFRAVISAVRTSLRALRATSRVTSPSSTSTCRPLRAVYSERTL